MRVAVLRHFEGDQLGPLASVFQRRGLQYSYVNPVQTNLLESCPLEHYDGVVMLGGSYEGLDGDATPQWLALEIAWVQEMLEAEKPIFAICFGAQVLCRALGGSVIRCPEKEVGWYPLLLNEAGAQDPVLSYLLEAPMQFHWHGFGCQYPSGVVGMAKTKSWQNQAFRYRSNVYGLQFHPDMTLEKIRLWLSQSKSLTDVEKKAILEQSLRVFPESSDTARAMFSRFCEVAFAYLPLS